MFVMISNGYGLFDEVETLVELLHDTWTIETIHGFFKEDVDKAVGKDPGTRAYSIARNAWLRKFLGVKRLNKYNSETDAFIKWMCDDGYAQKVEFVRFG
jgi:hypothetical protein